MPNIVNDNVILAMVQCALFMFYFLTSLYYLIFNNKHERNKYMLGVSLFFWSFEIIKNCISQFSPWYFQEDVKHAYYLFDLTVVPLCCAFILETIYKDWLSIKNLVYHIAPFLLFFLIFSFFPENFIFNIGMFYSSIYICIVVYYIRNAIKKYIYSLENNYSYSDSINIKWITIVIVLFLINYVFCVYLYLDETTTNVSLYIYYIYCLSMWSFIIYKVEKQKYMKIPKSIEIEYLSATNNESIIYETPFFLHESKLLECFEKDKIFLNPMLNIQDVAQKIGTNRTYLSNYLNKNLNTNFYDYVNGYRLNYAEEQLLSTNDRISDIAIKSGFNSMVTFSRYFKKKNNCTPFQFRQQNTPQEQDKSN